MDFSDQFSVVPSNSGYETPNLDNVPSPYYTDSSHSPHSVQSNSPHYTVDYYKEEPTSPNGLYSYPVMTPPSVQNPGQVQEYQSSQYIPQQAAFPEPNFFQQAESQPSSVDYQVSKLLLENPMFSQALDNLLEGYSFQTPSDPQQFAFTTNTPPMNSNPVQDSVKQNGNIYNLPITPPYPENDIAVNSLYSFNENKVLIEPEQSFGNVLKHEMLPTIKNENANLMSQANMIPNMMSQQAPPANMMLQHRNMQMVQNKATAAPNVHMAAPSKMMPKEASGHQVASKMAPRLKPSSGEPMDYDASSLLESVMHSVIPTAGVSHNPKEWSIFDVRECYIKLAAMWNILLPNECLNSINVDGKTLYDMTQEERVTFGKTENDTEYHVFELMNLWLILQHRNEDVKEEKHDKDVKQEIVEEMTTLLPLSVEKQNNASDSSEYTQLVSEQELNQGLIGFDSGDILLHSAEYVSMDGRALQATNQETSAAVTLSALMDNAPTTTGSEATPTGFLNESVISEVRGLDKESEVAKHPTTIEQEDLMDTDESDPEEEVVPVCSNGNGRGRAHIHLWQFLKELLANPKKYGSCIRWLDRYEAIFKIEDSVKVATLWGKRKNRPNMNYDKLSRSIRQYYNKMIIKKTEKSQRLVYQFCSPYGH